MNCFSIEKCKFFQDSLMFHQDKLFCNLPAVKQDIRRVMRISARETSDSPGLQKGQWISFLCSPSSSKGGVRKEHSHPLASLEDLVGLISSVRPETHKAAISPLLEFKYGKTLSLKKCWGFVLDGLFYSSFFFPSCHCLETIYRSWTLPAKYRPALTSLCHQARWGGHQAYSSQESVLDTGKGIQPPCLILQKLIANI